jgi:pyrrolysine biosynthesis protein PylD
MNPRRNEGRVESMTRLKTEDIDTIAPSLQQCDEELLKKTGHTLIQVAALAADIPPDRPLPDPDATRVAAVSFSAGQGVIGGFADTVRAITRHLGFQAESMKLPDVAGLAEAYQWQADIIFVADDDRFIAINTRARRVFDNSELTGRAFACVLDLMTKGISGKPCLVLGCGPVGTAAAEKLLELGAHPTVCDPAPERAHVLRARLERRFQRAIRTAADSREVIPAHTAILDATPVGNLIDAVDLRPETVVSAPGVPHGLTEAALSRLRDRFYHDPLQLGVATMALAALASAAA